MVSFPYKKYIGIHRAALGFLSPEILAMLGATGGVGVVG